MHRDPYAPTPPLLIERVADVRVMCYPPLPHHLSRPFLLQENTRLTWAMVVGAFHPMHLLDSSKTAAIQWNWIEAEKNFLLWFCWVAWLLNLYALVDEIYYLSKLRGHFFVGDWFSVHFVVLLVFIIFILNSYGALLVTLPIFNCSRGDQLSHRSTFRYQTGRTVRVGLWWNSV